MKKMRFMVLVLAAAISLSACGRDGKTVEKNVKETNEVVEAAKSVSEDVGTVVKDAVKEVAEEVAPGSTIDREDYFTTEDYYMAMTISEIGDYYAPLWETRLTDGTNISDYEGYDFSTIKTIDNIKYVFNETTKEAICTAYDEKAFQDTGIDTLTIPAEVEEYKVVAVDFSEHAGYNKFIKKVVIEDGVRQIHGAFSSYEVLEEIVIPDSVVLITRLSLCHCKNLKNITLPKNLMWLDGLNYSAITSVEIPENVKYLSGLNNSEISEVTFAGDKLEAVYGQSFSECPNLTTLQLPDSVKLIGNHIGANSGISEFTIPASFEKIDSSLTHSGKVAMLNTPYALNMGSDFLIWNDTLVGYYGDDETVTVPESVKVIAPYAFDDSESVIEVIVPEGIEVLGNACFERLEKIKTLTLPSSITQIGDIHIDKMNERKPSDSLYIGRPYAGFTVKLTGENKLVEALCEESGWEIVR